MLLRASGETDGNEVDIRAVTSAEGLGTGVPHGEVLVGLVDATLQGDATALGAARKAVVDAMGEAALVDAAAVIGTFTMQNRIADATGIPLDDVIKLATRGLRAEMGVQSYGAADRNPEGGFGRKLEAKLLEPIAPALFRFMGRRKKSEGPP